MKPLIAFRIIVFFIIAFGSYLAFFDDASAEPNNRILVDTFDDELNNDEDCSLREAIEAANKNSAAIRVFGLRKNSSFLLSTVLWGNVAINVPCEKKLQRV